MRIVKAVKTMLIVAVLTTAMSLMGCGGPEEPGADQPIIAQQTAALVNVPFNFSSNFGWGTIQPGQTLTSTTGPGPCNGGDPMCYMPTSWTCFSQALPPGITYSCTVVNRWTISFSITNTTSSPVVVTTPGFPVWHGMRWQ
jgi:hypothetical protein